MRLATAVLKDVALINPSVSDARLNDDDAVSFVPMSSLSAETASIESESTRSYREVKKGYTPFLDGDVLFAKITPCFENGKIESLLPSALVRLSSTLSARVTRFWTGATFTTSSAWIGFAKRASSG
jgi:hypothetical protein